MFAVEPNLHLRHLAKPGTFIHDDSSDVLEEDESERDVLVVAGLHVSAQLVGGLEKVSLEAKVPTIAVLAGITMCHFIFILYAKSLPC